jgi:lysophospholipase L1-like esterase
LAINHGVGGDTTHDMINRLNGVLTELKGYEKPLALVTLGINDIPRIDDNHAAKRIR